MALQKIIIYTVITNEVGQKVDRASPLIGIIKKIVISECHRAVLVLGSFPELYNL